MMKTGLISYGFYIPQFRISTDEIASHWGKKGSSISASLGIMEKTVSAQDEDALTMAYEAAQSAISRTLRPTLGHIGGLFVGSETHPYVVNPTSTILGEYLGIGNNYMAYDTQFACKAATGALISALAHVKSGDMEYALVVGADKATGKSGDALEYTAASAAAAFLVGTKDPFCIINDWASYSSDTPDFWRRHGYAFPSHTGRFTGYFTHTIGAVENLFKKTGAKIQDFDHVVFHTPNTKYPQQVAKMLGCDAKQLQHSLIAKNIGNSYAASVFIAMCGVFEHAKPGDTILVASYGSGAGSDAFSMEITKEIEKQRKSISQMLKQKTMIDYVSYLRHMGIAQ